MFDEILDQWDLPRPRELVRSAFGMSNESYYVNSAAGAHVLRVHAAKSLHAIRFEHEVLRRLIDGDLPFQVPQPLPTLRGDTVALDVDSARQCALFRRIPGETLDDADSVAVARAAEAFARLDAALAGIERTDLPAPVFTGDLRAMHPAVTDLAQLDDLIGPLGREMVERAAESAGPIYASLPTQLIHGDFSFGNVLVSGGRVRGIVDFEYSGRNVRAMELAAGLASAIARPSRESLWRLVLRGYLGTLRLDLTELAALPALAVLHWAVIVVWWAGRSLDGRPFPDGLAPLVDRALAAEGWMDTRGPELVAEAL
ncbi:MAG TPA: phosphotransferase, partial [Gemmatimonadaceae bacterium]|nr:phosphotransferase [Gemmatimonadaceae bacterium]